MTREETRKEVLNLCSTHRNILCELPTGFGKTRMALDIIKQYYNSHKDKPIKILITVPRNVLKDEWIKEITKWNMEKKNFFYTFTTYVSLHKFNIMSYTFAIFDECHHLSERCRDLIPSFNIEHSILLSATVNSNLKKDFQHTFKDLYCYKVSMKEAIDSEVLPDPRVYLLKLSLDNIKPIECITINPKLKGEAVSVTWTSRKKYMYQKKQKVHIWCTERQYNDYNDNLISWYKRKAMGGNMILKNHWLRKAGERLKWLAEKKNAYVLSLLDQLKDERTLTFCNNINQTEILGKYCINSKNKESINMLEKFNEGKINHITACNILNEGMNLINCRIGIYANLNSSERIIKQRLGRILRHKDPIIIIPYFVGTRDQELVEKMLEDYNPNLIKTIKNINEIEL